MLNLEDVQNRLALTCNQAGRSMRDITLVVVTKTIGTEIIEALFRSGICHFGENRVQEADKKIKMLSHLRPRPTWHMLGHLQSNKIRSALTLFDIIQSVDSLELARKISYRSNKDIPVLLQVNLSGEKTKYGFSLEELESALQKIYQLPRIVVKGLMTIAPLTKNKENVRPVFQKLRELRDTFQLKHLSMGTTNDFQVAIEEGATIVRIGRAIFGERDTRSFEPKLSVEVGR